MDTTIRDCPACGELVLGDDSDCPACGKRMPLLTVMSNDENLGTVSSSRGVVCPKCTEVLPPGVKRCRFCGWYADAALEEAAASKQLDRMLSGRRPSPIAPTFGSGEDDFVLADDVIPVDVMPMNDELDTQFSGGEIAAYDLSNPETATGSTTEAPTEATATDDTATTAAAEAQDSRTAQPASPPSAEEVAHSVQTGGDVLLQTAIEERREAQNRLLERKKKRLTAPAPAGHLYAFCGNGHRVLIAERFRGRVGKCPLCKVPFIVPKEAYIPPEAAAAAAAAPTAGALAANRVPLWITDVRLHKVNPTKLKLKADSLLNEYDTVDIGFSADQMLLTTVFVGGGAFRSMQEPKKKATVRAAILEHLGTEKPLTELPAPKIRLLSSPQVPNMRLVQPSVPGEESLFADIPVFGVGRIAIRVPAGDEGAERAYVSFTLTQYREFLKGLQTTFAVESFGAGASVPLIDDTEDKTCHYSDASFTIVKSGLEFYKADPAYKVDLAGRQCAACSLVVSEDSRKKEKLGGSSGSGIAKAPCPKCKQKFGDKSLFAAKLVAPAAPKSSDDT